MPQYARPLTDNITDWIVGTPDNTTKSYNIDEVSYSDSDYVYSENNTDGYFETILSSISDPVSSTGHIMRYRICMTDNGIPAYSADYDVYITAYLYVGGTLIAQDTPQLVSTPDWTTYEYTLSAEETDAISDYSALRFVFVFTNSSAPGSRARGGGLSWAELEVPSATVVAAPKICLMVLETDD